MQIFFIMILFFMYVCEKKMKIIHHITTLQDELSQVRLNGIIGFVPTMGALHQGHLALVQRAFNECHTVVVSIFVNPTQFNNRDDFDKYPRHYEEDIKKLEESGWCNLVFLPSVEEMYPTPDTRHFELGYLENIMEGKFRHGHFQGVAKVVSKFFDIIQPDKAYFGKKDFQQLAVIKKLIELLNYHIEIVPCEIVREPSGLAMSSRNQRLSNEDFNHAQVIYQALTQIPTWLNQYSIDEIKKRVIQFIQQTKPFMVEYIELVDSATLLPVVDIASHKSITCCIAVYCHDIRLIDNLEIEHL